MRVDDGLCGHKRAFSDDRGVAHHSGWVYQRRPQAAQSLRQFGAKRDPPQGEDGGGTRRHTPKPAEKNSAIDSDGRTRGSVVEHSQDWNPGEAGGISDHEAVAAAADQHHSGSRRHAHDRGFGPTAFGTVEFGMSSTLRPLRLGIVRYLNTLPLVEGLDRLDGLELVPAVPSHLAGMLADGTVDVALASIVDAVRSPVPLAILPCGMIGCDGPTLTVRLFSSTPAERVTEVFADTDSHTSVVLCQLLLRGLHGQAVRVVSFDARERTTGSPSTEAGEWPPAILLIGDKVVTDQTPAVRYPHQLDLGEAWKLATGLPFVYAAWMCRREDAESERVQTVCTVLDRQRRHNRARLNWIVGERARDRRWPQDLARRYLGELLRYDMGDAERRAAVEFLSRAAGMGLVPDRALVFVDQLAATV